MVQYFDSMFIIRQDVCIALPQDKNWNAFESNFDRDAYEILCREFEPWHGISNNVVCATSKASDQSTHTRSLIRAFASRLNIL